MFLLAILQQTLERMNVMLRRLLTNLPWTGRWSDERRSDVAVVRFALQLGFTKRVQAYKKESRNYQSRKVIGF
jgi:hypothetical protein